MFATGCKGYSRILVTMLSMLPLAGQSQDHVSSTSSASTIATGVSTPTLSGYTEGSSLEGGDSVTDDLAQDDRDVGSVLRFPRFEAFFEPWFDAKKRWKDKYGLKLQFSYQVLGQQADSSPGEDEAAAGRGQIQGTWTLLGRGTKNPGMLSFRVENRHTLGTEIPPTQLGSQFGSAAPTGTGFSNFGSALTELAWRQTLLDGKMKAIAGKISAISWYNTHALSSSMRGFQNTALQSSLSKPAPGRGIGGGAAIRLGDRFVALAGIHDANAVTTGNPFDTIDEGEFYTSAELRWFPTSFDRRRWDQVKVSVWHQDERTAAGIPSSQGATFLASYMFNDFWMPFVYGGVSNGEASIFEADLVAGVGFGFNTKHRAARDVLGLAVGWGRPADKSLQEQYTSEMFYRFQLVQNVAITPSVQYIKNPAKNPEETSVWVAGVRARWTF